mmetsp:Transcript_32009/g.55204  ORF Transcript_32009/g.55204 Transcript_32009/m.55204 type:complete len:443 (+) Transcript_32009:174-1502(+)
MDAVYNHPLVQNYLSSYSKELHERVIRATFLYGLMILKQTQSKPLSVDELEEQIRQASSAVGVKDLVNSYKKQLEQMKADIERLDTQLSATSDEHLPRKARSASPPKQLTMTTSHEWRKGDSAVFRGPATQKTVQRTVLFRDQSPPALRDANYNVVMKERDEFGPAPPTDYQDKIYPDWWKDLCAAYSKPTPVKPKQRVIEPKVTRPKPEGPSSTRSSRDSNLRMKSSKDVFKSRDAPTRQTPSREFPSREQVYRDVFAEKRERLVSQPIQAPKTRPTFNRRDIAVEADFSSESSSVEATPPARSHQPRQQDHQAWAMDFTNFIKNSPPARDSHHSSMRSHEEEEPPSAQESSKFKQSVYSQSSEELRKSQSARSTPFEARLASSSQYSGSSMSAYHPSEEVKTFYRNEFPNLLDSNGTQSGGSLGSSWRRPPPEHSFSLKV